MIFRNLKNDGEWMINSFFLQPWFHLLSKFSELPTPGYRLRSETLSSLFAFIYFHLRRHYFALPTNSGEQFFTFTSLAAWLLNLCGRNIDYPQEVGPTTYKNVSSILPVLDTLRMIYAIQLLRTIVRLDVCDSVTGVLKTYSNILNQIVSRNFPRFAN